MLAGLYYDANSEFFTTTPLQESRVAPDSAEMISIRQGPALLKRSETI